MKRKITAVITAAVITLVATLFLGGAMQTSRAAGTQNWVPVGNAGFSAGTAYFTSLAFDDDGTPYVAYTDNGNGQKATVMKYTGSSWETVGAAGFSADGASQTSLAFDNSGTPFVAFEDGGKSNKVTVMKYTGNGGSGWETVGMSGFSVGIPHPDYLSLVFDHSGMPYVLYSDAVNGYKATVMKYTGSGGSGWETVGMAGFSASDAYYTSLAFDNAGTPYVAYADGSNYYRATVMKYTGSGSSGWETVGTAGFSASGTYFTSLAFDNAGTLYVAFGDRATVMKYTGSSWETVGAAGFSAGGAYYISLAFNGGTPYVAYQDYGNSQKATVMKYTGSSWETAGTAGFSAGNATYVSLAVDNNGTPYVAYRDYGNGSKATVMRLNSAPADLDLVGQSVSEEQAVGTVVGTLSPQSTDQFERYTYSLVSGSGDDDNGSFSISGDQLKTAEVFDYETRNIYHIRVRATDIGGLVYDRRFTVAIQNIQGDDNDNAIIVDMGPIIPKGAVGSAYSFTPAVTKGTAPYTWTATGLPAGLSINASTGKISGIPSSTGTSAVSATVTDSRGAVLMIDFDITIGYASLAIDTPSLFSATIGKSYACSLSAFGGDGSNSWYASGLPKGLSMGRESGKISGTPGETGTFSVEVQVYDSEGRKAVKAYSLTVSSPSATGKYEIVPDTDSAYSVGSADGFLALTIKSGVSGFRYFNVSLLPAVTHEGEETVVFVQKRHGVQIGYSFVKADFDAVSSAGVGFNVAPGDIIRVYIVDSLSNSPGSNPVLLQ